MQHWKIEHRVYLIHLAKRGKHVVKIFLVDEPVSVVIDHVEGLFELLKLKLMQKLKKMISQNGYHTWIWS